MNSRIVRFALVAMAAAVVVVVGVILAVSLPTSSRTPTVSPAPATFPSATPSLPTQTYPGTLVVTRSEPGHNDHKA